MEYHRTKDILFIKQLLGHTNINAALIYTHLIDVRSDEYHVRVAKTIDEAKELLEVGLNTSPTWTTSNSSGSVNESESIVVVYSVE